MALFVLVLFLFGVGCALIVYGVRIYREASASRHWPSVPGLILEALVVCKTNDDGPYYCPRVTYSYCINDVVRTGDLISLGMRNYSGTEKLASEFVFRYPAGLPVRVFYDPNKPSSAVLEPGFQAKTFIPTLLGSLCVGFAIFFGHISIKYLM
jgi:hypothetical protein